MQIRLEKKINCLCLHNGAVFRLWFAEFIKFVDDDDCEF